MTRSSATGVALALLAMSGCGDTLVLRDRAAGATLTYDCRVIDPRAAATTPAERELIRRHAEKIGFDESGEADYEILERLSSAENDGDWVTYEQLVVDALWWNHLLMAQYTAAMVPKDAPVPFARIGDRDNAIAWLEKHYAARGGFMTTLRTNPVWDVLRGDPRFEDLLRRVKPVAPTGHLRTAPFPRVSN